jgi:hypothetical protein
MCIVMYKYVCLREKSGSSSGALLDNRDFEAAVPP